MKRDRNRFYHSSLFAAFLAIGALAMCASHACACMDRSHWENAMAASDREFHDSGVTQATADVLSTWYSDFAKKLRLMVLKPTGKTDASKEFNQARAASLVQQIDELLAQLNRNTGGWVKTNVPAAYGEGLKRATQLAIDAGVLKPDSPIVGSFSVMNQKAVQILAADTASDLGRAAGSAADRAKSVLRRTAQLGLDESKINKILAQGIVEGTPAAASLSLRKELIAVHGETVEVVTKNGGTMNFDAKYYADMVARTKTRQAVTKAQTVRLSESGIDLVAIVGRVSKNFCSAFLGQVFSISGKSDKYPALSSLPGGGPPFHPNCSKSTRPFIDYLADDRQLKLADGLEDAQALLGKDASTAQRLFQDLQIKSQVESQYTKTITKIFGSGPAGSATAKTS